MRKILLIILCGLFLAISPCEAAVDFEADESEYLSQNDGLSTDISGADQKLSICAWFKAETLTDQQTMVSKFGGSPQSAYILFLNTTGGLWRGQFFIDASGNFGDYSVASSGTGIAAGEWHHVCGVYNDTDVRAYLNGVVGTPDAHTTGVFGSTSTFDIGRRNDSGTPAYFDGVIDEVYVWNTDISADEVAQIYNSKLKGVGRNIKSANLQLYCSLDECPIGADNCSSNFNCSPGSVMAPANTPSGEATILNLPQGIIQGQ